MQKLKVDLKGKEKAMDDMRALSQEAQNKVLSQKKQDKEIFDKNINEWCNQVK